MASHREWEAKLSQVALDEGLHDILVEHHRGSNHLRVVGYLTLPGGIERKVVTTCGDRKADRDWRNIRNFRRDVRAGVRAAKEGT